MAAPLPLPVVQVTSLDDVDALDTDGGPSHVILVRAKSLADARAILSALRAKGALGEQQQHGADSDDDAEGGADQFGDLSGADLFGQGGEGHGFEFGELSGADQPGEGHVFEFGVLSGAGHGIEFEDVGDPVGWVALLERYPDLGHVLEDILSDPEDPEGGGGGGGGPDNDDEAADGWVIQNLPGLLRAADLSALLDEVVADTLPRLANNSADAVALRGLRFLGMGIRRVGRDLPGLMGQAPVTLGNYIQKIVRVALIRGGPWFEERRPRILVRVLALLHDHTVHFT